MQRDAIPLLYRDVCGYAVVRLIQSHGCAQQKRVGTGEKPHPVIRLLDERRIGAESETDIEKHLDRHLSLEAFDDPDNVAVPAHRHEVDNPDRAAVAHKLRFENHGVVAVTLPVFPDRYRWAQAPSPVLVITYYCGETSVRIKARRTQPVY
jgi:hypothetical protein